jgi:hypothetical protein
MSLVRRLARVFAASLALTGAAALSGCSHVPVGTMWALRSFDPATTDLARLRAAVAMPADAMPSHGGAKLVLKQARRDGTDAETLEVVLEEVPLAGETGAEAIRAKPGQTARAFRVPIADLPRLAEARTRARERSAKEPGAFVGTLSVGVDGCRAADAPVPTVFRVSTWMKTADTPAYLTVLDDVDLVAMIGREKFAAEAKVCAATGDAPRAAAP